MSSAAGYQALWEQLKSSLQNRVGEFDFGLFRELRCVSFEGGILKLSAPLPYYPERIQKKFPGLIEECAKTIAEQPVQLIIDIDASPSSSPSIPSEKPTTKEATPSSPGKNRAAVPMRPRTGKSLGLSLNANFTFDRYIVDDNNNYAANAAQAISRNPGTAYNPLLIFGGVGLGKTHLMQAIGHQILNTTDSKIIYITAESFTNEFIESIANKSMSSFKNKYRYADTLLIDDVHFFSKKMDTQEELFHTFNALYNSNKQMVFTCDRPVDELKEFNDRLLSRFNSGIRVNLQPPSYETRVAILRSKLQFRKLDKPETNLEIPDTVIDLIARNIQSNIRDLEAAIMQLVAYGDLTNKPITLETAHTQLKDSLTHKQSNVSLDVIAKVITEHFHLSPNDLRAKKKPQKIVYPRQLAMYIAGEITQGTTTEIGEFFNKDHTTVLHSVKKIKETIKSDSTIGSLVHELIRSIKETSIK